MSRKWVPDQDKRKGFLLHCGHYEAGGIEYKPARGPLKFECPHGCGMVPRMSAQDRRRRSPALPDEPEF